ncbi:MAG: SDR family oxidoreductase, partial [Treponema sp.]|nr:SDR family oxidoreductase [Treponema sp.]
MKVLITGTSRGIGRASALKFLSNGHEVFGIDIKKDTPLDSFSDSDERRNCYHHFCADISDEKSLPEIENVEILINNAGIQSGTEKDISVNLLGTMNVTEKYA